MFRRLMLVIFAIILATLERQAAAQQIPFPDPTLEKLADRGYTDKELNLEKRLLRDKSRLMTWECLPLVQFPRSKSMPGSPEFWKAYWTQLGHAKEYELELRRIEAAQKRFIESKLKDHAFSGTVRIARKEPHSQGYTIYAKEPARPKPTDEYSPPRFALCWPAYLCQWESESDQVFKVGENVEIVGRIEDLKEDGKENTLFLKSVEVAKEREREKAEK